MKTMTRLLPVLALLSFALASSTANAVDTDPLDFVAPKPDLSVTALYFGRWFSDSQYADSHRASNANIHSEYGVLAYVRFFEVNGCLFGTKAVIPASHVDIATPEGVTSSGAGVGDPKLVFPIWLLRRPKSRTYLGFIPYLQFPLGSYRKGRVSPGANRFTFTLQPGFTTGLTEKLSLDLVGDVQTFTNNTEIVGGGSAAQNPLFSIQTHLTYDLGSGVLASVGGYEYLGGSTKTRGTSNHDYTQTTTLITGLNYWVTASTSLQFQYRSDVAVRNGAKFDGLQFRFLSVF